MCRMSFANSLKSILVRAAPIIYRKLYLHIYKEYCKVTCTSFSGVTHFLPASPESGGPPRVIQAKMHFNVVIDQRPFFGRTVVFYYFRA
jgi:hypothetical protein